MSSLRHLLYPVLRLFRRLRFHLQPRSIQGYDQKFLAELIVQADKRSLDSGVFPDCVITEVLAHWPSTQSLRILDFGGGGGRHGFNFPGKNTKWAVVETESMVAAAKIDLERDWLSFHNDIEDAGRTLGGVDIAHVSSSLQYTPRPIEFLEELLSVGAEYVLLEKLVITDRLTPIKFFQYSMLRDNVPGRLLPHGVSDQAVRYLLTAEPKHQILSIARKDYSIVREWQDPPQSHLPLCKSLSQVGLLLQRKG